MPRVGFEPTTPVSERTKTVHGLDHAATVIGVIKITMKKYLHGKLTRIFNVKPMQGK
jgi:hypothetical protein